jgi:hypothetical protein
MHEDLEQIATLKFGREMESISGQTRERVKEMQNEYAALTGSSGVRSGQHEASIGRAQIHGAERLARALFQIWIDLLNRRNGHISRGDIAFIANRIDSYAGTQKAHLRTAFSQQRMGAVVNVLTQEAEMRMHAVGAEARRELEIMVREHEAFPNDSREITTQLQMGSRDKEGKRTRHTAEVLNVLIASPSDVSEERAVVEKAIRDWDASHFSSTGMMLNPVKWESHAYPASGDRPQAIINRQIVESGDILIGIFGYKLGTPTGEAQSGTIEEIEEFRKAGKYVALYFSTADVPRSADRTQLEALESYKKDRQKDTLYFEFEDVSSLRDHLIRHLPKIVHEVREGLNLPGLAQGSSPESSAPVNNGGRPHGHSPTHSTTLLADIISELEDNLSSARAPRVGDVYKRPSNQAWKDCRNKVSIPEDLRNRVAFSYRQIDEWLDIVASGLNPNIGSAALELKVNDLRRDLPNLITELKKLEGLSKLPKLSSDAQRLLLAASGSTSGSIMFVEMMTGLIVQVDQQQFAETGNRRSEARWREAVEELLRLGLIKQPSHDSDVIDVTHAGFEYADKLRSPGGHSGPVLAGGPF